MDCSVMVLTLALEEHALSTKAILVQLGIPALHATRTEIPVLLLPVLLVTMAYSAQGQNHAMEMDSVCHQEIHVSAVLCAILNATKTKTIASILKVN